MTNAPLESPEELMLPGRVANIPVPVPVVTQIGGGGQKATFLLAQI